MTERNLQKTIIGTKCNELIKFRIIIETNNNVDHSLQLQRDLQQSLQHLQSQNAVHLPEGSEVPQKGARAVLFVL